MKLWGAHVVFCRWISAVLIVAVFILVSDDNLVAADNVQEPRPVFGIEAKSITEAVAPGKLTLTLSDVLSLALKRQARIVMAQTRVSAALARLAQSRSSLMPQLAVVASGQRQTRDLRAAGLAGAGDPLVGPFNSFDARLQLTQSIFDLSAQKRLQAVNSAEHFSREEYRKIKNDVLALTVVLFVEACRAQESREVLKHQRQYFKNLLDLERTRLSLGIGSVVDFKTAKAQYRQSLANWQKQKTAAQERMWDLQAALGIPFEQPLDLFLETKRFLGEKDFESFSAEAQSPEVQMAVLRLQESYGHLAEVRAGFWPVIKAVADYGPSGQDFEEFSETYSVGMRASLPLWEGGSRSAQVAEMNSRIQEDQTALEDVERQANVRILKAHEMLSDRQALVQEKETALRLVRHQKRLSFEREQWGLGRSLDHLKMVWESMAALDQVRQSEAMMLLAQIELLHAEGQMEEFALSAGSASIFDPSAPSDKQSEAGLFEKVSGAGRNP